MSLFSRAFEGYLAGPPAWLKQKIPVPVCIEPKPSEDWHPKISKKDELNE